MSKSKGLTFKGGIHPSKDGKALSSSAAIQDAPLLEEYQLIIIFFQIGFQFFDYFELSVIVAINKNLRACMRARKRINVF